MDAANLIKDGGPVAFDPPPPPAGVLLPILRAADVADFNELKAAPEVTQGNLSVQLRKLGEAGYVTIEKGFLGRKPGPESASLKPAGRPSPGAWRRWRC